MALQSSGIITLYDIQAEFGGPTSPRSIFNYYRGGTYVPDTTLNANIPTSGMITLFDFYGAASQIVSEHSMVVGQDAFNTGYNAFIQSYGSISPSSLEGVIISTLLTSKDDPTLLLRLLGSDPPHTQDFFTSMETPFGTFNSADATFTNDTEWRWTTTSKFVNGTTVDITFYI